MPRFLGRDYYNDDFIARRELSARTSLTVPGRFKEDKEEDQTASCSDVYGTYKEFFLGELRPFDDDDDDLTFSLEVSDERVTSIEQIQWITKWKKFDGNYIEIVPSSNPDSESSLFDSQPESVSEECECTVEEFSPFSPQLMTKDIGYLEEPVDFMESDVLSTNLPKLLKWSTEQLDHPFPALQCQSSDVLEEAENSVTEEMMFGNGDLHLEVTPGLDSESLLTLNPSKAFSKVEEFDLYCLTPGKAEELMYPVTDEGLPPSSQQLNDLVHEARKACIELGDLEESSWTSVDVEKVLLDADETIMSDMIKIQQPTENGLEKLLTSPVAADCQPSFLSLNNIVLDKDDQIKSKSSVLECPLHITTSVSSPFEERLAETLLQPWSPNVLVEGLSPLLSDEGVNKLEAELRYREACFGKMQMVKFMEPNLYNETRREDKPSPIAEAVQLASSVDWKSNLGQVELNLIWDITPSGSHQYGQFCPEALTFSTFACPQSPEWMPSIDFEVVEAAVERDREKKMLVEADAFKPILDSENPRATKPKSESLISSLYLDTINSKSDAKCDNIINNSSELTGTKPAAKVSKRSSQSEFCVLQSFTSTMHGEQKTDSNFSVQQTEKGKNNDTCLPKPSSQLNDPLFKTTLPEKKLDILETPSVHPTKCDTNASESEKAFLQLVESNSRDGDKSLMDHIYQPAKDTTVVPQDSSPQSGKAVHTGFDLRFEEDDLDLGSDSFMDVTISDKKKGSTETKSTTIGTLHEGPVLDPLDHFLMMRDARTTGYSIVKPVEKTKASHSRIHHGVITPMSVLPRSVEANEQRFVTINLSGPYLTALQEMCSQAEPHMDQLRTHGVLSPDSKFLALQPDYTRFLLKDRITRLHDDGKDEVYKYVAMVHTLRLAAHMLMHCCLESAIVYLGAMQDKHSVLRGSLEGLRKALFHCQFTTQQSRQLHPKIAAMCREIQQHKQASPSPHKMLIVIRREQSTLMKTLQSVLSLDGTIVKVFTAEDGYQLWPSDCECVLTWDHTAVARLLPLSSLVLEFEADLQAAIFKTCETKNISYIGLTVQEAHMTVAEERVSSGDKDMTVVGSQYLIQYQQLLQLLETRHNIIVVRRDYASLGRIHYPDVVASIDKGAVLLPVQRAKEEGGLERTTERLAAVGLQLSCVWILLHGMGESRNVFDKDALKKVVQLQALMANLTTSAKGFATSYKVLLCRGAADVALYISRLCTTPVSCGHQTDYTLPLPSVEISQEEKFLLCIPCLNPFSCSLLLSRATVGEIMVMTLDDLRSLAPELTDSCLQNLHRVVNMDRGLQLLRPLVTDTYPSEMIVHTSQDGQPSALQGPSSVDHGKVDKNRDPTELCPNPTSPHSSDPFQRQAALLSYPYQSSSVLESMSLETTVPNVPLNLSKSLHYTDQPTPFLLPSQKGLEIADCLQGKSIYSTESNRTGAVLHDKTLLDSSSSSSVFKRQGLYEELQQVLKSPSCQTHSYKHHPEYFQAKVLGQASDELDIKCGPQKFTPGSYHSIQDSFRHSSSSLEASTNQQKATGHSAFSSHREGETFFCPKPGYNHQSTEEQRSADTIYSSMSNTSAKSANSIRPLYASAQASQQNRHSDQQRMFGGSSSQHKVELLGTLCSSDAMFESKKLSPYSNQLKMMVRDSVQEFAPNQHPEAMPSYIEARMSHLNPEQPGHTNPQISEKDFWSSLYSFKGNFKDDTEWFSMKSAVSQRENYLTASRSKSMSVGYPFSPSWQNDASDTWDTPYSSAWSKNQSEQNRHLSAEDSESARPEVGFLRGQSNVMAENLACHKESASKYGDMLTVFRQLDNHTRVDNYYSNPIATSHHRDEKIQAQPTGVTVMPRACPSFSEDLAATTRRLLQGRSPGHSAFNSSGHQSFKSRITPVHRISVGFAQPLRREDSKSSQESGNRRQVSPPVSPKRVNRQQALSPPLDMDWGSSVYADSHHITDAKLKKWSAHLQYKKQPEAPLVNEELCPSAERKRAMEKTKKLTYLSVPGAGGQTKLAFL